MSTVDAKASNANATPPSLHELQSRDSATLLYENGISAVTVSIASSTVLAFLFSGTLPVRTQWIWWGLITTVLVIRAWDIWAWKHHVAGTAFNGRVYRSRFAMGTVMTGLAFAAFPIISFSYLSIVDLASIMVVLAAMAGGAASVLSACLPLAVFYNICLLLPMSICSLLLATNNNIIYLGLLGCIFWLIMLISSRKSARFISQIIFLHNENNTLIEGLAKEKANLQTMHGDLQHAYNELNEINETLEERIGERTQALEALASKDSLTGLLNRHSFLKILTKRMDSARKHNRKLALLFIDLDGFKEINDVRGHRIGDYLLQTLSDRFCRLSGMSQSLCRWGGDEFILCAEVNTANAAISVAESVLKLIREPAEIEYDQVKVSATIGIALYPDHCIHAPDLIHAADMAMYECKHQARGGSSLYAADMLESVQQRQKLKENLTQAIQRNELQIYYQPIVDGETHLPKSFEALLRWHSNGTMVPPDQFIPIAEQSGAIHEIGAWVLQTACHDASSWQATVAAGISVNVSVKQLLNPQFLNTVDAALENSGLSAELLNIEITESVFAEDKDKIALLLSALRSRSIKVSIDDFGTGFSSLAYLQALPFDEIKIDKTFIQNNSSTGAEIVKATISIARAFGCEVVAEGVEHEDDHKRLKRLGVDLLQGFFFARPQPIDRLEQDYFPKLPQRCRIAEPLCSQPKNL